HRDGAARSRAQQHPLPRPVPHRAVPLRDDVRAEQRRRTRATTLPSEGVPTVSPLPAPPAERSLRSGFRRIADPQQALRARAEPMLWLSGGALAIALLMVSGLLFFVLANGAAAFWPSPLVEVTNLDGKHVLGEVTRVDTFSPSAEQLAKVPEAN